jgi:hypothetical protein
MLPASSVNNPRQVTVSKTNPTVSLMRNDLLNTAAARIVTSERVTKMPKTGRMAPESEVAEQLRAK